MPRQDRRSATGSRISPLHVALAVSLLISGMGAILATPWMLVALLWIRSANPLDVGGSVAILAIGVALVGSPILASFLLWRGRASLALATCLPAVIAEIAYVFAALW
jgi:hypothetical protein